MIKRQPGVSAAPKKGRDPTARAKAAALKNNQPKSNGGLRPESARPTVTPNKIEAKNIGRANARPPKPAPVKETTENAIATTKRQPSTSEAAREGKSTKVAKNSEPTKPTKATKPPGPTPIALASGDGRTDREAIAYAMIKPSLRHGQLAGELGNLMVAQLPEGQRPGVAEYRKEASKQITAAEGGDLTIASQLLAAQALSLDAIFTELARRSAINLSQHLDAAERYMRMALKAQSGCRTTLQALADLHRPREQIVKHVTVAEGGQAVVADQFHNHQGGPKNELANQPHAQGACGPSLSSPDPSRDDVPVPGNQGEEPLQAPWRPVDGGANG